MQRPHNHATPPTGPKPGKLRDKLRASYRLLHPASAGQTLP